MREGVVYLVGAGPGDPGLLTVKGRRCVETADVVVHDRLVDKRILRHAREQAEVIDVGKVRGQGGSTQPKINSLLVQRAKEGRRVVRLKGGDPFVFGRGGEEADALREAGVAFQVVPGVTSAIAAPAYAGIPLTHRGVASAFTVVTGTEAPGSQSSPIEWEALARRPGTLVLLMAWESLPTIVEALLRHGKQPDTPTALVRWGTEPYQQTVVGTLESIEAKAAAAGLRPPVVAIIGEVVRLRERLRWFDNRPLWGRRVLVTRTRTQAGALSRLLDERGADAIELPTIETRPMDDYGVLDDALADLQGREWVVFTSTNAVGAVFDRLRALGLDSRALHGTRVAAIGPTTASDLEQRGIKPDFVPDRAVSEALAEGLIDQGVQGGRVLLPRADAGREVLARSLREAGAAVDDVPVYRTVAPSGLDDRLDDILDGGIDAATFTSSSTVRNLVRLLDGGLDRLSGVLVACIGPVTAATAREMGLEVGLVAREHTIPGLVDALEQHFAREESPHD